MDDWEGGWMDWECGWMTGRMDGWMTGRVDAKGIKNQCKSWVGERIPEGEQSPCAPGSAPQVPK